MLRFNRTTFFDNVRESLFYGSLSQDQVDGQDAILAAWEMYRNDADPRWLAYELATTIHETASTMMPIEEYGKGSGSDYGDKDPETGQAYYGRGYVQLTWRDNYAKADREIMAMFGKNPDCEWHAENALVPKVAAGVMFLGMEQGWFRGDDEGRQTLERYFNDSVEDPVNARDIINGDISKNGGMIAGYYEKFLYALTEAAETVTFPDEVGEEDNEHIPGPSAPEPKEFIYTMKIIATDVSDIVIIAETGEDT